MHHLFYWDPLVELHRLLSSCMYFLPWLFSIIADFTLIKQEEEEEETQNYKLIF